MKILVLGSGAREHAIILALAAEGAGHDLLAAPGNAGIARDAEIVPGLDQNDPVAVTEFAGSANVDLVIVGPEAPLIAGVADALRERGIPVFARKVAAQLEGSKAFAKRVMDEAGVPTGRAVRARSRAEVEAALDELGAPTWSRPTVSLPARASSSPMTVTRRSPTPTSTSRAARC